MSEELIILQEHFNDLGLTEEIAQKDLNALKERLLENGENGLAEWVSNLKSPQELLDYVG